MDQGAFITGWGVCLPNEPVSNDQIEDVLGRIETQSAAVKRRVLMNNGINRRFYAIDPESHEITHTNARLTADAIRTLCEETGFPVDEIECLACGTSVADQLMPSHTSMVHADLGAPPCETAFLGGVCTSGLSALKYGYLNVLAGDANNAIVTGSELASPLLRASHFGPQLRRNGHDLDHSPMLPFSNEFLRWMLSDGAGALLLRRSPNEDALSLRVDWIDIGSYASQSEVCMYLGLRKEKDGSVRSYRGVDDEKELAHEGYLSLSQDVRILNERLPELMRAAFARLLTRRQLIADEIDWVLPHYSSQWFRQKLHDGLADIGFEIPFQKWFTNLSTKGNTGSAALYIMIEELMATGRVSRGQRILCIVPESSRMIFGFAHFTVV